MINKLAESLNLKHLCLRRSRRHFCSHRRLHLLPIGTGARGQGPPFSKDVCACVLTYFQEKKIQVILSSFWGVLTNFMAQTYKKKTSKYLVNLPKQVGDENAVFLCGNWTEWNAGLFHYFHVLKMAASVCIVKNFLVGLLLKFIITRIVVIDSPHIESTQFHFNDSYFTNSFTNRLSGLVKKFQIYRLCISLCGLLQYDICNHTNKRKHYQFISHFGQYTKKDLIYKQTILLHYFSVLLLLLSTDVHPNPGPGRAKPNWKFPCGKCSKPVRCNQQGVFCENCKLWWHQKCVPGLTL